MRKRVVSEKYADMPVKYMGVMGIAARYGVGKSTAEKIAKNAGAVVHIGRRKLVNIEKTDEYMEKQM